MSGEFPSQIPPTVIQTPTAEQVGQIPVLSPEVEAIMKEAAQIHLLGELRRSPNTINEFGAPSPADDVRKIRRLWEESTGLSDRERFDADYAAMEATFAAHGGPEGYIDAIRAKEK